MKYLSHAVLFLCLMPLTAHAQEKVDHVSAQLISAYQGNGDLPVIDMALDVTLQDQWYSYWRMPGDNGLAPVFDWSASTNVKNVAVSWPIPKRYTMFDMHSFGYSGEVVYPLAVTPIEPGKDISLNLKLDIMVCHDICIPQTLNLSKNFPAGEALKSEHFHTITKAKEQLPRKENSDALGIDTAILGKDAVVITAYGKESFGEGVDLIIETPRAVITTTPEIIEPDHEGGKTVLKLKGPENIDLTKELFGKTVTILLIQNGMAIEKDVTF